MDWQQATALGLVALTALLFLRSWRLSRRPSWQRGAGCACSGGGMGNRPRVCVSGRRGEAPRVTVRP